MRSIAGSVVVLAGALVMGLASNNIPNAALPTLTSLGLILIGLLTVLFSGTPTEAGGTGGR